MFSTSMGYIGPDNSLRLSDGTASFKYNALGLGTKTVGGASNYYTRDPNGQLLSDRTTSGTYNYVFDGLGSVVALTSSTCTVAKTYSYDPGTVTAGTGTVDNPWQYASDYYDSGPNYGTHTHASCADSFTRCRFSVHSVYLSSRADMAD